ncbi:mycothiol system anti-sigma-R factor [uncultured Phycicoccus sp.]|uniref:mycothiol system anti-sigma-R factor n=1 Tax=uncultured Phycicoccus sp. TaxID=661422 RepID=UPI002619C754|nr:mycothiol system anti-sigma-R factor [uncultured Phycicoccus sp.]
MGHTEHEGHSDCSEVLHHIYEYLDGEMSPADVKRVATHLAECRPCLAEHDLDAAVKQVVKRSCHEETAPATLRLRIVQRITTVTRTDLDG